MVNSSYRNSATETPKEDRRRHYAGKHPDWISRELARHARADNTQRNYRGAWNQYRSWCAAAGIEPLQATPAELGYFLGHLAIDMGYPPATIRCKLAALRRFFRDAQGRDNVSQSDEVRAIFSGIQREFAQRPLQAAPFTRDLIQVALLALPDRDGNWTLKALRDRALMLVGYGCAFRRSEISGLRMADVRFEEGGATLFLDHSKGDQLRRGTWIGLGEGQGATCPVAALRAWMEAAPDGEHVFRPINRWGAVEDRDLSHHAIGLIVKHLADLADQDPEGFSGHSLRAGIVTDLVGSGMSPALIQERTRHRSPTMIATYHRPKSTLQTNFTRTAGL